MRSIRIMRFNPSITHKDTTKHTKAKPYAKLREIYTRKSYIYDVRHLVINSRMGRKRRTYYHDNRYDDPWSNTEGCSVRCHELPYNGKSWIWRDKDLTAYIGKLENKLCDSKHPNKVTLQNEIPELIDNKELKAKILYNKPKGKVKKDLIRCHYDSLDHAIYSILHDYLRI